MCFQGFYEATWNLILPPTLPESGRILVAPRKRCVLEMSISGFWGRRKGISKVAERTAHGACLLLWTSLGDIARANGESRWGEFAAKQRRGGFAKAPPKGIGEVLEGDQSRSIPF